MNPEDRPVDPAELLQAARRAGLRIATAESCTGGMVAAALTDVAGSSDVFERGFVTYSNAAKAELLGVDPALTGPGGPGAVSEPVARAMAEGAIHRSPADIAVSVTGIAGPGGGSAGKPVGLVHFGWSARNGAGGADRRIFPGGRPEVRAAAVPSKRMDHPTAAQAPKPIAGRDLLIAVGVAVIIYAFAIQFVPLLRSEPITGSGKQLVLIGYLAANLAAFGAAVSALLLRNPGYTWLDLGIRPVADRWKRRAVLIGLAATPAAFAVGLLLRRTFDLDPPVTDFLASTGFSWIAAATIILYGGLLVPLFEELFFRGLVYSWLRNRLTATSAIPLSALAFAVVHLRIEVMVVAFAMGCMLAWLYEKSRSVLPCILLHQTFNTAQLAFVYGAVALAPDRSGFG